MVGSINKEFVDLTIGKPMLLAQGLHGKHIHERSRYFCHQARSFAHLVLPESSRRRAQLVLHLHSHVPVMLRQLFGFLSIQSTSIYAEDAFARRHPSEDASPAPLSGERLPYTDADHSLAEISLDTLQELNDRIPHDPEAKRDATLTYREPGSRRLLHMAVEHGLLHVVERLLFTREVERSAVFLHALQCGGEHGREPLFQAARSGDLDFMKSALDPAHPASSDLQAVDPDGNTPMMHAASLGHGDLVLAMLLEKTRRAEDNREYICSLTHHACLNGHYQLAERIESRIEHGNFNRAGRAELLGASRLAYEHGHTDLGKMLLERWRDELVNAVSDARWDADIIAMAIAAKRYKRMEKGKDLHCFVISINQQVLANPLRDIRRPGLQPALSHDDLTRFLQQVDMLMPSIADGARFQAAVQFQHGKHTLAIDFQKSGDTLTAFILDASGTTRAINLIQGIFDQVDKRSFHHIKAITRYVYLPDAIWNQEFGRYMLRNIQFGPDRSAVFALDHLFHLSTIPVVAPLLTTIFTPGHDAGTPRQSPPHGSTIRIQPGKLKPAYAAILRNTQSKRVLDSLLPRLASHVINRKGHTLMESAMRYRRIVTAQDHGGSGTQVKLQAIEAKRKGFIADMWRMFSCKSAEDLQAIVMNMSDPRSLVQA
jgi:hypothetical protein